MTLSVEACVDFERTRAADQKLCSVVHAPVDDEAHPPRGYIPVKSSIWQQRKAN